LPWRRRLLIAKIERVVRTDANRGIGVAYGCSLCFTGRRRTAKVQRCTFAEYLSHLSASNVREKPFSEAETGDRDIAICRANSNLRVSPFAYQLVNFRRRAATQLYRLGKIIDHFSVRRFCVDVK
jgi:hypothetical protein